MGMEASGRIHAIFEAQQVTERFRKREFVLELGDNPRYPQFVIFQLTGDVLSWLPCGASQDIGLCLLR